MVANLGSDQGATPALSSTQLTRPSLFILVATLALAGAYQPVSGSFVFGPSSRFWRISPISSFVELYMIVKRVLRAVFRAAKSAFIVATHVDANLIDARLAYAVGATQKGDQPFKSAFRTTSVLKTRKLLTWALAPTRMLGNTTRITM